MKNRKLFWLLFPFTFLPLILLLIGAVDFPLYVGRFAGDANGTTNLPGLLGQMPSTNRTIYVDANLGDDTSGNGTQEKPFKTIGYQFTDLHNVTPLFARGGALGIAGPGDTIKLMPGDHTNQIVQLWCPGTKGISLVGEGSKITRLWLEASFLTTSDCANGEGFVQLGNGSLVQGISFPRGTASWANPISDGGHGNFLASYWADTFSNTPPQLVSCTNAIVRNIEGWGINDAVFLSYICDYDVKFYDCDFTGGWDQAALYGHDTNRINQTEWWNCTFRPEGSGIVHGVDLHGGHHYFHNCVFAPRNGAPRMGLIAGTYGCYAEDGFSTPKATNYAEFYNCKFDVFSTNAKSAVDVTNYSSIPGNSILKFYNCVGDVSTPGKWTNWVGSVSTLAGDQTITRYGTGRSPFRSLDGITADGAASFGLGRFVVSSGGSLSMSGQTVITSDGSISVPAGQTLDIGGESAEFGPDASFTGPVNWDASGNFTATSLGVNAVTITSGSGAPSTAAPNGSIYLRTDGGSGATLYVRARGAWTAVTVQ